MRRAVRHDRRRPRARLARASEGHQEEGVHDDVKVQRRKYVAGVVVVPHANLHRDDGRSVEEEHAAQEQHHCKHHRIRGAQRQSRKSGLIALA